MQEGEKKERKKTSPEPSRRGEEFTLFQEDFHSIPINNSIHPSNQKCRITN
jgi:hypothetical protein